MPKPVFFNVFQIQMPVGAITSIAHRITGLLLALGIPFSIYLLDLSLDGPAGYQRAQALLGSLPFQGVAVLFAWALAHHLLAGIRHMLSDVDIGSSLHAARRTAWAVNCLGVGFALLAGMVFL